MIWHFKPGIFEYTIIGIFIFLYILWILRIIIISRKIKSSPKRVFYKFFLRSAYFALIILSFLGPSFGDIKKEVKVVSKDIFICLDLSASMNAYDVPPSRLEKTKNEIKYLSNVLKADRMGLIAFADTAVLFCPLTYDASALQLFLQSLHTGIFPKGSSDLSSALQLALNKHLDEKINSREDRPKIVILFSDGEDFGEKAANMANHYRNKNIILYTVGVGTEEGSKIPYQGSFKKDQNNIPIVSRLNRDILEEISILTGGNYFQINEEVNQVEILAAEINRIKGIVTDVRKLDVSANKYFYFLLIALFLILIDILVTVRTVRI